MAVDLDKSGQVPRVRVYRGPTLGSFDEPVNAAYVNLADYFTSHSATPGDNQGVTDCFPAVNEALAALALAGGGTLFIPPGLYKFLSQPTYNHPSGISSIRVVGAGQDITTLFWPNASGGLVFNLAGPGSSFDISNLTLTTGQAGGGNAITAACATSIANPANTANSHIKDICFRGSDGYALTNYWSTAISLANVSNVQIINPAFVGSASAQGNGIALIGLPGSATYGVVYNIDQAGFFSLNAGIVYGSYVQGVTINESNFTGCNNGVISPGSQTGTLAQLAIVNSQFAPAAGGTGIATLTAITEVQIANCLFIVPASGIGIDLAANNHFTISACEVTAGVNSSNNGIVIGTALGDGTITGNDIFGFTTGIDLAAGSANTSVQGNTIEGCSNAVINSGTNNVIVNNPGYNPVGTNASATMGTSPFTVTAGASPETHYVLGTGISQITKGTRVVATAGSNTIPITIQLDPGGSYTTTWATTAPTYVRDIH